VSSTSLRQHVAMPITVRCHGATMPHPWHDEHNSTLLECPSGRGVIYWEQQKTLAVIRERLFSRPLLANDFFLILYYGGRRFIWNGSQYYELARPTANRGNVFFRPKIRSVFLPTFPCHWTGRCINIKQILQKCSVSFISTFATRKTPFCDAVPTSAS